MANDLPKMSLAQQFVDARTAFFTNHAAEIAVFEGLRPEPFIGTGGFVATCDDAGNVVCQQSVPAVDAVAFSVWLDRFWGEE